MTQSELNKITKAYHAARNSEIQKIVNRIAKLFNRSFKDVGQMLKAARLVNKRSLDASTKKKIEKLCAQLFKKIQEEITAGAVNAHVASDKLSYAIETKIFGKGALPTLKVYGKGSERAALQILNQTNYGKKFSARIWKQQQNYRKRIENVMVDALKEGKSAKQAAKDLVSAHYKNTSGKGAYTDPRKNAERLTRTEINKNYQRADHERWKKAWYIKGIRVDLSNSHPVYDLCDKLATIYPKDFVFIGWHPNCLCHAIPILVSEAEQSRYEDYTLGLRKEPPKIRYIAKPPAAFNKWIEENKERMMNWKSGLPDWVLLNEKYVTVKF